jgi:hypothetical protein
MKKHSKRESRGIARGRALETAAFGAAIMVVLRCLCSIGIIT